MADKQPVGRRVGSKWTGWHWEGGCTCGSGKPGREVFDDNGIYFGIGCSVCKRKPADGPYEEAIEED